MSNGADNKYAYKSLLSRQTSARRRICFNSSGQIHSVAEFFVFTSSTTSALKNLMTGSDHPTFTFFNQKFLPLCLTDFFAMCLWVAILDIQLLSHFLPFYIFLSQTLLTTWLFSYNSESKLYSFAVFGLSLESLGCRQLNPWGRENIAAEV